jgi:predicted metal-dependent hydrolase
VTAIDLDGRSVAVVVRRSALAARMSLRLDAMSDAVVLVMPPGVPEREGLRFVAAHRDWIVRRLAALPPRIAFAPGAELPVLGEAHVIEARPEARRGVWAEDGRLNVSGRPEHLPRRVLDWLKRRAEQEVAARAFPMAESVERRIAGVVVRDQRSRWGSCTADGRLAFSWRLVLAPAPVLTYVVAHEVAHLVELNHSPAFWRVVRRLMPDMAAPRHWLKLNGAALHRYG